MSIDKNLVNFDEIVRYEEGLQAFLSGEIDPDRVMSFRLQHGIYGQRQKGVHMVRVKVPGGGMSGPQLAVIADCLADHSEHDVAHVPTRQDFQLHYVPTKHTGTVKRKHGDAGLTTREACTNTERQV